MAPRTVYSDDGLSIPASDKINGTSVAMNIEKSHYLMKCTVLICLFILVLCGSFTGAGDASIRSRRELLSSATRH